jgi:hypothetical protein
MFALRSLTRPLARQAAKQGKGFFLLFWWERGRVGEEFLSAAEADDVCFLVMVVLQC